MTPFELRSLTDSCKTPLEMAHSFANLTEADRKKLSKTAQEIFSAAREGERQNFGLPTEGGAMARLIVLACCPFSQAKRVNFGGRMFMIQRTQTAESRQLLAQLRPNDAGEWYDFMMKSENWSDAARQILLDRRPDWAGDWVELQLNTEVRFGAPPVTWFDVRTLMKAGVIERPKSAGYIELLAQQASTPFDPQEDADVLENDVWRLFEVETTAFTWFPEPKDIDRDKWRSGERATGPGRLHEVYYGWPRRLYELAHQGQIDRGRLIDSTLAAFWRDFKPQGQSGLTKFLEVLESTDDEIAARQKTYIDLLRNNYGPVVAMVLKALTRLQKAGRLDVGTFLEGVPAVFQISKKSQPQAALLLIERAVTGAPEYLAAATGALAGALDHPSAEIQERAVALLAKWKEQQPAVDLSQMSQASSLPAHQKRRLEVLAKGPKEKHSGESEKDSSAGDFDERRQALRERLAALPKWVCKAACLDNLDSALEQWELPEAFQPEAGQCPVLSGVEPIEPIQTVDELIDAVAHVFETVESPEAIERVIDGIMRLGGETVDGFAEKTEGLRHPVEQRESFAPPAFRWLNIQFPNLVKLVGCWLGKEFPPHSFPIPRTPDVKVLEERFAMLMPRWRTQQFGAVLSTPTHRGGWIDPRVFVERLKSLPSADRFANRFDFIGGLLRLAPDFRDAALESAREMAPPYGPIVRYALGGDERPAEEDVARADEWLAAGRTRQPRANLDELQLLGFDELEPNGITCAKYEFQTAAEPKNFSYGLWNRDRGTRVMIVRPQIFQRDTLTLRPMVAQAVRVIELEANVWFGGWMHDWIASIWPHNTDAALAIACYHLISGMDRSSAFEAVGSYMSALQAVDRGWSELARIVIWLGILSRDDEARGRAIDALVEGIADGRADAQALADALVLVTTAGWAKLNRLADGLREVTRTSILAERVVAEILDKFIASWKSMARDAHHVLDLELQLLSNLQQSLTEQAREVLTGMKAGGKTGQFAKRLCALSATPQSDAMRESVLLAAEGRIARAERIARYIDGHR